MLKLPRMIILGALLLICSVSFSACSDGDSKDLQGYINREEANSITPGESQSSILAEFGEPDFSVENNIQPQSFSYGSEGASGWWIVYFDKNNLVTKVVKSNVPEV